MPVWIRLSIAGAATLLVGMGLGRFSYSPLIPALIEQGGMGASEAATAGVANFVGYVAGALIAPVLRQGWGEANALRISLIATLAALFCSILPWGFFWLAFWRAVAGASVGVIMIYALSIATRFAPDGKLGAATGITYTGVGIGILLAGTLVPALLNISLAAAWTGIALAGSVATVIAFWGWRAASDTDSGQSRPKAHPPVDWNWHSIGVISARTLFSLGLIPHTIYWVDYLVRGLGNDNAFGGMHWALFGIGAISGTYLWGRFADRIGFRGGLTLAFAAVSAGIALPVLTSAGWALVVSSLIVGAQPGLTAILSGRVHQLMGPDQMPGVWRAAALISTIIQAAGGFGYVILFAVTDSYVPVFLAGAAAMGGGAVIAWCMKDPVLPKP